MISIKRLRISKNALIKNIFKKYFTKQFSCDIILRVAPDTEFSDKEYSLKGHTVSPTDCTVYGAK